MVYVWKSSVECTDLVSMRELFQEATFVYSQFMKFRGCDIDGMYFSCKINVPVFNVISKAAIG